MVGSHGSMSKMPTTTCLVSECHIVGRVSFRIFVKEGTKVTIAELRRGGEDYSGTLVLL